MSIFGCPFLLCDLVLQHVFLHGRCCVSDYVTLTS